MKFIFLDGVWWRWNCIIFSILFANYFSVLCWIVPPFYHFCPFVISIVLPLCFWDPHSFPWICYQIDTINCRTAWACGFCVALLLLFQKGITIWPLLGFFWSRPAEEAHSVKCTCSLLPYGQVLLSLLSLIISGRTFCVLVMKCHFIQKWPCFLFLFGNILSLKVEEIQL